MPTTDVAVEQVAPLIPWLKALLSSRLEPLLSACFPVLADGTSCSSTAEDGTSHSRIRLHDAFIVRYQDLSTAGGSEGEGDGVDGGGLDAQKSSLSLPPHCDTSCMSAVISLNRYIISTHAPTYRCMKESWYIMLSMQCVPLISVVQSNFLPFAVLWCSVADGEYSGGGTWYEAIGGADGAVVNAEVGSAVLFAGQYLSTATYYTTEQCSSSNTPIYSTRFSCCS